MKRRLTFLIIILMQAGVVLALQSPAGAPPIKSPETKPDGSMTFRLAAPKAAAVLVRNTTGGWAEWPQGNELAMSKDDQGVWSTKGVNAIIVETPGYGHEWAFWRMALSDFAPRLFQPAAK